MAVLIKSIGPLAHLFRPQSKTDTLGDMLMFPGPCDDRSSPCLSMTCLLGLPNELQTEILSNLRIKDIFALRLSCRELYFLMEQHQKSIVRHLWSMDFMSITRCGSACMIHGIRVPERPEFNEYYHLRHQKSLTTHVAISISFIVGRRVFGLPIRSGDEIGSVRPLSLAFERRICQPLMHILQWLTRYREKLVEAVDSKKHINHEILEASILEHFSLTCLLHSWGMFRVLLMVIKVRTLTRFLNGFSQIQRNGLLSSI